jgi:hypothetical protein
VDKKTGEKLSIPLDPEEALRALLKVDPTAPPADPEPLRCTHMWNGKRCLLRVGHFELHLYDL